LETLIPSEVIEDFRIVVVMYLLCAGVKGRCFWSTHFQHAKLWQLSTGDEKSIHPLKTSILLDMTYTIPSLVPTQFQESKLPHKTSEKTELGMLRDHRSIYLIHLEF
jgi:hypothetical protein